MARYFDLLTQHSALCGGRRGRTTKRQHVRHAGPSTRPGTTPRGHGGEGEQEDGTVTGATFSSPPSSSDQNTAHPPWAFANGGAVNGGATRVARKGP